MTRRQSVRELKRGPSHLYQRLLYGEINADEYVRVLKEAVRRTQSRRRGGESNPGDGLCRPAPNHSATAPEDKSVAR